MAFLTVEPIDPVAVLAGVASSQSGAAVLFLGTVREQTGPDLTAFLEYEAYAPMAEREAATIEEELRTRFPAARVRMVHRTGRLGVGEISVAVAVSCPHRADAFAAARWAIDTIKERVPVWKRDIPPTGPPTWVHPEQKP